MKESHSSPEYHPYVPGTRGEDGNEAPVDSWEEQRDKIVHRQIRKTQRARGKVVVRGNSGISKEHHRAIRMRFDPEFRRRERMKERLVIGGVAVFFGGVVTTAVLAGIHDSQQPPAEDLSPEERFEFDYIDDQSSCLSDTAYDVTAGSQGKSSFTPPSTKFDSSTGVFTITPPSGKDPLSFEGFYQTEHTITPLSEADRYVFESYPCDIEEY